VPTVLICEDEPALRELIRVSLQGGYSFAEADDGIGCLELVREVQPDVVSPTTPSSPIPSSASSPNAATSAVLVAVSAMSEGTGCVDA
jgi:hypothetical protein